MMKRPTKPRPPNEPGGVIEKPAPIHLSNVSLIDPKDGRPTRVRIREIDGGADPRVRAVGGEAGLMADGDDCAPAGAPARHLRAGDPAEAPGGVRVRVPDAAPAAREDHPEHGRRRGQENTKALDEAVEQLGVIAGQRPSITRARKSIAQFKLREGMAIGCKVTLRGNRMWEFLDRLQSVALPRIRDFRGINPDGFDGRGNYNLGLREQTIFPEIDYDRVDAVRGLNVTRSRRRRRPTRRAGPSCVTWGCRSAPRATRPRSGPPAVAASRGSSAADAAVLGKGEDRWRRPASG